MNELLDDVAGWYGDAAFFGAMAHQPTVFERLVSLFRAFPRSEGLSPELLELVRHYRWFAGLSRRTTGEQLQ
ncbi:MAG: hypothetical protein ABEJ73_06350 [Haloplanus sp.]